MKKIYILILLILVSGCTTSVWSPSYYHEKISGFYISEENNILIASGIEHGYVFELNNNLYNLLSASNEVKLNPFFHDFELNKNNEITGFINVGRFESDLNPQEIEFLYSHNFTKNNLRIISLEVPLQGKRFLIDGELPFEKFEKEYEVNIVMPRGAVETIGNIAVTPTTLAIDTVAIIPLGALFFVLPFIP